MLDPEIDFYLDDVTRSSPFPHHEINSEDGCRGQLSRNITCMLSNIAMNTVQFTYAKRRMPCYLSTRVNPGTFRIRVDGQIRF